MAGVQRAALTAPRAQLGLRSALRWFRAAPPVRAADKEALLRLRRSTGLPFVACQEALRDSGGDVRQAELLLSVRARDEGRRRAERLRERRVGEGLLGLLHRGRCAVMVEVNCESDFVARNTLFQQLVRDAALGAIQLCCTDPSSCTKRFLSGEELSQLRVEPGGGLLSERLTLTIGAMGENMALRRAALLSVPPDCFVATYTHGPPPRGAPPAPHRAVPGPLWGAGGV